jgi:hypothetical protein
VVNILEQGRINQLIQKAVRDRIASRQIAAENGVVVF